MVEAVAALVVAVAILYLHADPTTEQQHNNNNNNNNAERYQKPFNTQPEHAVR